MPKTIEVYADRLGPSQRIRNLPDDLTVQEAVDQAVARFNLPPGNWGVLNDEGVILGPQRTVQSALAEGGRYTLVLRS